MFSARYLFQSSGEETTRIQVLKVLTGLELRLEPRWFFSSCIQWLQGSHAANRREFGCWPVWRGIWKIKKTSRHELGFHHASRSFLNVSYFLLLWNVLQKSSTAKINLNSLCFHGLPGRLSLARKQWKFLSGSANYYLLYWHPWCPLPQSLWWGYSYCIFGELWYGTSLWDGPLFLFQLY